MCGIFSLFLKNYNSGTENFEEVVLENFNKGEPRGPENSVLEYFNKDKLYLGFHRLAINGFGKDASEQPLKIKNCVLICNGEIYNWKELHKLSNTSSITGSDCEIIIHLYKEYGIEQTLQLLDGVFAFVLWDKIKNKFFVARDTYGVRPLYVTKLSSVGRSGENIYPSISGFSSEIKNIYDTFKFIQKAQLKKIGAKITYTELYPITVEQYPPGNYSILDNAGNILKSKSFSSCNSFINSTLNTSEKAKEVIRNTLISAVEKRVDNTDREIACLLSGGLDSSLITSLVVKISREKFNRPASKIHTWSVGMKGSEDLEYAQKVADFLGTTHHAIELSEDEFLEAIEPVIYAIESYDTTSVRASVGNWLISKYIKKLSEAKVIFNGDGSDELTGGYLYFHAAPDALAFDEECRRLLKDIHFFDVLRSDKSISSHGLEPRTPFLDRTFVQTYLSIPAEIRCHNIDKKCEKYLLRSAFEPMKLLPEEVLWRTKEAFSDGVSKKKKSWFEVIQDFASELLNHDNKAEAENMYYKNIYSKYYDNIKAIPYKWMPKFVDATDASARTLKIYSNVRKENKLNVCAVADVS